MKKILLTSLVALGTCVTAQVTGTKTIGVDYPTLLAAFADLNAQGVGTGGAIINLPAGYTETAPTGGFVLGNATLNATLSSTNPLIIQKSGSGSNPIITGGVGSVDLTATGNTNLVGDTFFKFVGVDYVTIDGIDLKESSSNTTATTLNERGFAFLNLSATDGSNFNTVKNSKITFSSLINYSSVGVYFAHYDASGVAVVPTSVNGTNSSNKVYSNNILNAASNGIAFNGYAATSPYTLYDQNNDIGGTSAATANTISNFGSFANDGYGYITSYAVFASNQNGTNASYNNITFGQGIGAVGIYLAGSGSTFTANNNTITATDRNTYYASTSSLSSHYGIFSAGTGAILSAANNTINIGTTAILSGTSVPAVYGIIHNSIGNLTLTGNNVKGLSVGSFFGIYSGSTGTLNVSDNSVSDVTTSATLSSSTPYGIYLASTATNGNVLRNKVYNLTSNGAAGLAYGIYVGGSTASTTTNIVNNLVSGLNTPSSSSTSVGLAGIYLASTGTTSNLNVYYNSVYLNATSSGANFNSAALYHANSATATTAALDLRNNVLVNTSTPKGTGFASALRRNATGIANYSTNSNNNDFYSGTGTNQNIYYNGTTAYTTLSAFQTFVASREANSLSVNPLFKSTVGTNADFLKLNESDSNTQLMDNAGQVLAGYTTDYAGITRNASTPDVGAYEFTYVAPTTVPGCVTISTPVNGATNVVPNPTTLNWASVNGATSYKVYAGTTSGGTEIANGASTTAPTYSLFLQPNTSYYVKVIASNNIGDATGCSEITFTTGNFVYCASSGTTDTNTGLAITRVVLSNLDNTSTRATYTDYTGTVTAAGIERQRSYTISITNGSTTGYYTNDVAYAWIDYNHDGVFDDSTERTAITVNAVTSTASITVPANAVIGVTRMRVRYSNSGGANSNTACGTATYGEVEDYAVEIKEFLAVSDTNKVNNVSVYPNPFADVLKISDIKGVKSISVNDISGRQVKTFASSAELNLSNLKQGLYIVNLKMEDGSVKSFKAIKK